ncbi:hypothetical protein FXN63_03470 [Pigmentiphaga aceris]|uniref:Uncharacterized protein n=1 Tax=Pigmentiphaga aceris TaxID=1940612 RepID=A0A5C0ATN5_9BURK|nr:hypothetical protein [Pigmentiphaga aceris]QEI05006.1 hypothetical protein FXN63_03470 [Pigmentiphaga aceris]
MPTPPPAPEDLSSSPLRPPNAAGWDVDALTISRALGYVVGLPSFILGTATFMLGFALMRGSILNVACVLYSVSAAAIGWRVSAGRWRPKTGWAALRLAMLIGLGALLIYAMLRSVLWLSGVPAVGV